MQSAAQYDILAFLQGVTITLMEDYLSKQLSFWQHLSEQEKNLLCKNTTIAKYSKGKRLHNGDDCIGVLLVVSGHMRVFTLSDDGRDITLYRLFTDDICILSASCAIEGITFEVIIEAEEHTELLFLHASTFNHLQQNNVYVENFAYKLATSRFSDVMWTMEQILFMGIDKRLAIFLWDEMSKNKKDEILMTHEQIARLMGSAREVISRMLKYFANEGIVDVTRGNIRIIDKIKLRKLI